jgi:SAM-dependent methyltransferase
MDDGYRDSAEFLDIMSRDAWRVLAPLVVEALGTADPGGGPVVDIGAGSGLGTLAIAKALPQAEIVAVEPSPGLRAVLLSRVHGDPDLARRVTVLDTDIQRAVLSGRFGAVVAMNMIGHLEPPDRRALWAVLASRLAPGAPAVLNLQPPDVVAAVPDARFCEIPIGHRVYEGWGRAEPLEADAVTWQMRYRVLEDGVVVGEHAVEYPWWIVSPAGLRAEIAEHGLVARQVGPPRSGVFAISIENDNH